jgi:hypothetical protein
MSTAVARKDTPCFTPECQGPGFSSDSKVIDIAIKRAVKHREESLSQDAHFKALLNELVVIVGNCFQQNWDGYNADPVTQSSVLEALTLLRSIKGRYTLPDELTAEPDGSIALDWYGPDNKTYSVSVNGHGNIIFSGRFPDGGSLFGVHPLSNKLPQTLAESIYRIKSTPLP